MEHATTPPTAPHPGDGPKRLVRTGDGKIAGVAAGIGHYLGIDPTIIRIAFIVLAFAGGVGLLLYVISWIVMPRGEISETHPATELDTWAIVGVVGLVVGVGMLVGWHGVGDGGRAIVAVALVIGGVLLVGRGMTPRERTTRTVAPVAPVTPPAATPAPPAAPAGRGRRPVTGIVLSLLALGIGIAIAAQATGVDLGGADVIAAGLVLVGAGLLAAAFVGGAPWLIVAGSLLTVALIPVVAVETLVGDGIGSRSYAASSVAELDTEYRLGVGELDIDLRGLDLEGRTERVVVTLGIGDAQVIVPSDVDLEIVGHVDAGRLEAPNGDEVDGIDRDLRSLENASGSTGRLIVELDIGLGEGVVTRG